MPNLPRPTSLSTGQPWAELQPTPLQWIPWNQPLRTTPNPTTPPKPRTRRPSRRKESRGKKRLQALKTRVDHFRATHPNSRLQQILHDTHKSCQKTYGFAADPDKTLHQNITTQLKNMSISKFFNTPQRLKFHQLSENLKLPSCTHLLLGLGSKFCIEKATPNHNLKKTFGRLLSRDIPSALRHTTNA